MIVTRNEQTWALFAPEPLRGNRHLVAIVTFEGDKPARELDLTLPVAQRMRQLTTGREGRLLKAHDTLIKRRKANWLDGLANRTCADVAKRGEHPKQVTLAHDDEWMTINPTTFEVKLGAKKRTEIGSFSCSNDDEGSERDGGN